MDEIFAYVKSAPDGELFPSTRSRVLSNLTDPQIVTPLVQEWMLDDLAEGRGIWSILMDNGILEE